MCGANLHKTGNCQAWDPKLKISRDLVDQCSIQSPGLKIEEWRFPKISGQGPCEIFNLQSRARDWKFLDETSAKSSCSIFNPLGVGFPNYQTWHVDPVWEFQVWMLEASLNFKICRHLPFHFNALAGDVSQLQKVQLFGKTSPGACTPMSWTHFLLRCW